MTMYVDLLTTTHDGKLANIRGDKLVDYALACRATMLASRPYQGTSAYSALAADVAYDRALLKLCASNDISVDAADFSHPSDERTRLEHQLRHVGIDLAALARARG